MREDLLEAMDPDEIVAAADTLDIDDLAELMGDLPDTVADEVLKSMEREDRERLEHMLTYEEDTRGPPAESGPRHRARRRHRRRRAALPAPARANCPSSRITSTSSTAAASTRAAFRSLQLLIADPATPVNQLMDIEQPAIDAHTPVAEVAQQFADHDWVSAPVVDDNNVLLGRITVDDVIDIIREQAEHRAMSAAGLDEDEDLFSPVPRAARRRAIWLGINLLTAFLASWVIGNFEAVIAQVVAVAVLMPIVASMGGIAGTQVLTLMVRALALGQVGYSNALPLLRKEILVATANGVLWALVVGGTAFAIYRNTWLAVAFGAAMIINLLAAALAGVAIPLILRRMAIDPALAGGVILTTVTDCCGFASFLGLSTLLLLH